jgi:hypothetical protein
MSTERNRNNANNADSEMPSHNEFKSFENEVFLAVFSCCFLKYFSSKKKSSSFKSIETLKEKLQIKSEALNLLGKQVELCNKEKLESKRLIDTLYEKNLALKKMLYLKQNQFDGHEDDLFDFGPSGHLTNLNNTKHKKTSSNKLFTLRNSNVNSIFNEIDSEDYVKVLKDLTKSLQKEKYDLEQKFEECEQQLQDARTDLRLLREQIVRQRTNMPIEAAVENELGISHHQVPRLSTSISSFCISSSSSAFNAKENLIKEIESLKQQKLTLENELNLVQCQKEEIEIERDSFKNKYLTLNKLLIDLAIGEQLKLSDSAPKQDNNNNKIIEVDTASINKKKLNTKLDELIAENKYLNEIRTNLTEEVNMLKISLKKFKATALSSNSAHTNEKSNKLDVLKEANVVNKNQIKSLLNKCEQFLNETGRENDKTDPSNAQSDLRVAVDLVEELKVVMDSLLECLSDKLVAGAHQRKVNKMLAVRIQELEKQMELRADQDTLIHSANANSPFSSVPSYLNLKEPHTSDDSDLLIKLENNQQKENENM